MLICIGVVIFFCLRIITGEAAAQSSDKWLELLVVTDTYYQDKFVSTTSLENYLIRFLRAVSQRLHSNIQLRLRLLGFKYLNATQARSIVQNASDGSVRPRRTADLFQRTFKSDTSGADAILLVTNRNVTTRGNNSYKDGAVRNNALCNGTTVFGVVSAKGMFNQTVFTMARFVGKMLGADYDGVNQSKACPASDGYIMGDFPEKEKKEMYQFSNCSREQLEASFKRLNGTNPKCLGEYSGDDLITKRKAG